MKDLEILGSRLESLSAVNEYVGVYYSVEYIRRYILQQSDSEIEEIDKQIEAGVNIIQIFDSWAGLLPKKELPNY